MPSPMKATLRPPLRSLRTASTLPSGRTSATTSSMSSWRAMAWAVRLLSPVIIATLRPERMKGLDGLRRRVLYGVGHCDNRGQSAVDSGIER